MDTTKSLTVGSLSQIERELERDPHLKSPLTRITYKDDLTHFETWRGDRPSTKRLVEEYAAHLQAQGKSPNSINRKLAAIRWWARRRIDIAHELPISLDQKQYLITELTHITTIQSVKGERSLRGREITSGEYDELIRSCESDKSPAGTRDRAIFSLLWQTALRRSEVVGLNLSDMKIKDGQAEFHLFTKGDKEFCTWVTNGSLRHLQDWLDLRSKQPGPLFLAIDKAGQIQNHGLTDEALRLILLKRCAQAGIEEPTTLHDFRRSLASDSFRQGIDPVSIQHQLNHSQLSTTGRYDRRKDDERLETFRGRHTPYHVRKTK